MNSRLRSRCVRASLAALIAFGAVGCAMNNKTQGRGHRRRRRAVRSAA